MISYILSEIGVGEKSDVIMFISINNNDGISIENRKIKLYKRERGGDV